MMNQYPWWKYLIIIFVLTMGTLFALPNIYGDDPAIQIKLVRTGTLDDSVQENLEQVLSKASIDIKAVEPGDKQLLVRFNDTEAQLKAVDLVKEMLGSRYVVALNLAPATPEWLKNISGLPMYMGLDLRGGVHFLMEVDMDSVINKETQGYISDMRTLLRENKVGYSRIQGRSGVLRITTRSAEDRNSARKLIAEKYPRLGIKDFPPEDGDGLILKIDEDRYKELRDTALQQNILTLRNRVNELGVAEPVIQQQGDSRIVVQLPGVQDTAQAKKILGATATLEYRAVDTEHDIETALAGNVPAGSRLYYERDGSPVLLKKRVIVTGDQITGAASGFDQVSGGPVVTVNLDSDGARRMLAFTRKSIGKPMAVVFIENKTETKMVNGVAVRSTRKVEEVVSIATIRDSFSRRFQTTGLDSSDEAHDLALLLRSGALAAPIEIVEERTVGPSLGKENISLGFKSVVLGFSLVLIFMAIYYRVFGLVADLALTFNLVLIVAVLSMFQATLTLPGIAGIVLTVGMAVDANVLIFERIREELRNGNSPQASIHAGYEKAFSTIADANITTLIAAVVLLSFGTGPIKGFAVTLTIGILTSMFTAILGTRAVINLIYGGKRSARLMI